MPFNTSNPVTVGAATKKDHYDRVFDNTLAQKDAQSRHNLGGRFGDRISTAGWTVVPGFRLIGVNGSKLGGNTVVVDFFGYVPSGIGQYRLFNTTTGGVVAGSTTNITVTGRSCHTSAAITLAVTDAINYYRLEVNINTAPEIRDPEGDLVIR